MSKKADYEYLDDERRKLWSDVVSLREKIENLDSRIQDVDSKNQILAEDVKKKTSDYEQEAKNASSSAVRYKNKAIKSSNEAQNAAEMLENFASQAEQLSVKFNEYENRFIESDSGYVTFKKRLDEINISLGELTTKAAAIEVSLAEAKQILAKASTIEEKLVEVETNIDAVQTKILTVHSNAAKKGKEISTLHDEVFGYVIVDPETDEETAISGLKEELDESYSSLKKDLADARTELHKFKEAAGTNFEEFVEQKKKQYDTIKEKIQGLLPDAMTAGLSHAYEKKRISEEEERGLAEKIFTKCIWALTLISIIPVVVSIYLLLDGKGLDEVIEKVPRLVLAILPLYAPAFWFAITASKRVKLSKRLIEEYTHKESLSKTFEGLSTQVSSLQDSEVSRDLRLRLLYNMVTVSSDNPGRLISDYNSSDNPLLDVLDKSTSLTKSLEKISAIPGIERLLQSIEKRRETRLAKIGESLDENVDKLNMAKDQPG